LEACAKPKIVVFIAYMSFNSNIGFPKTKQVARSQLYLPWKEHIFFPETTSNKSYSKGIHMIVSRNDKQQELCAQ